jgi:hypothetical protein
MRGFDIDSLSQAEMKSRPLRMRRLLWPRAHVAATARHGQRR